ncbi:MAG TPA: BREX-1 system adenine-specific DNA-methyltransferase PglX [Edaphobacter sp.]|uniref:BREX-1 system adenine-specific DNA-methyltransferase PglX n=1 Tax=Edaphobacter sp. TaxID=1934404 RepID=UPI002C7EB241|nr:BREX-1 system adenine-specific DNA-methyltransferase PglX [Edaphobacter sp.]HUZ95332.1 BREX-1 system adenine-specific DNA-methyltransferase PglX [Edaphobacter sp.]
MNKANLKSYAPKARLDFIAAVTARANILGISANGASPADARGDIVIIDGREWPAKVSAQRDELIARIQRRGFEQTMEEVAYTWFNRIAALRFMEIHEYLDHGWRVLSSRDGGMPEIIRHASELSLPGLNAARAREMQLAGDQDNELYKLLLVAQCNELSRSMPFLFEHIDDKTELLLPEYLLRTDSIVAKLVAAVPEEDWQQIEVIGWLYQFYISEKKDQVIGKVVRSEDIPAATQLFTPNWIVQYLVQNSVGRLWLMANPGSSLATQWPFYIQPTEQTSAVQVQVDRLIQSRIHEDGEALNPETITVLDPACGSGHILVVAYDVLKVIYLERGYQPRAIPRLILEKNLYGLDIDDRAAQLAAFALLMKARADDRRLLSDTPKINVLSLQESKGLDADELFTHLAPFGMNRAPLKSLLDVFECAKTLGSLIEMPTDLNSHLAAMMEVLEQGFREGDLYARQAVRDLCPLLLQARVLGARFDAVVANPPYMGAKGMEPALKKYAINFFAASKSDLFAMFIERGFNACKSSGFNSMVTMQSWMFLPSYELLRSELLAKHALISLIHLPYEGKSPTAMGINFGISIFTFLNYSLLAIKSPIGVVRYFDLTSEGVPLDFACAIKRGHSIQPTALRRLPGSPILPAATEAVFQAYDDMSRVSAYGVTGSGLQTSDNNRFLRLWFEIDVKKFGVNYGNREDAKASGMKWFPHKKGGPYRKWYGNDEFVVNWEDDGQELFAFATKLYGSPTRIIKNVEKYFREGITWSHTTSSYFSARVLERGFIFNVEAPSLFDVDLELFLAFLCSNTCEYLIGMMNPTMHFVSNSVGNLPFDCARVTRDAAAIRELSREAVAIARSDWNAHEVAWNFDGPLLISNRTDTLIAESWRLFQQRSVDSANRLKALEEQNNAYFINLYGLGRELQPGVPIERITLTLADRERDCQRLISYAIGCMMGRYSLDEPGLIYAHAGSVGFDAGRYVRFPADADGIVPLTDQRWFEDDAAGRVPEFLRAVWGGEALDANLRWLADSLVPRGSETPDETLRRYLSERFFKDHLQTYKKRPIYWLFSSGKQGAFQALVYLHRYHEGTLGRLRAEYVVPLVAKVVARLEILERDAGTASSAAARTKIQKHIELLRKKQIELLAYDEKLRHYADMRIVLDLDDGVKINYGKFGELLAESKAVTGGSDD